MHANTPLATRRAGVPPIAHASLVQRRLGRYQARVQVAARALAQRGPQLADLAASFPALLFALAVPRRAFDPAPVIARVIAGASLAELGKQAGVPLWLRKLPPEAFLAPLPKLPDGALFCRQIANHLPRSPCLAPTWLQAVADAAEWGSQPFAVWIAREVVRDAKKVELKHLRLVALWAWYSGQPTTRGNAFIDKPWSPSMHFKSALEASENWYFKLTLHLNLGDEPIADMWLQPGHAYGYDFVPLGSAADIADEGAAMQHCVTRYGSSLAHNRLRLWSVHKDGRRIATLQVAKRYGDPLPDIVQLKLARNKGAPVEVWWAARRWLNAHDLPQIDLTVLEAPLPRPLWVALWRPYWLAKSHIPDWLPIRPSRGALALL